MTELQRWHHPSYEERWTNYGCICRFLKGIHWILSYIGERGEFVQVNDRTSELTDMQFGVPQGLILGPVVFYSYANDLNDNHDWTAFWYADERTSSSTVPLQIWTLTLENWIPPYKPLKTRLSNSNLLLNAKRTSKWWYAQNKCQECIN